LRDNNEQGRGWGSKGKVELERVKCGAKVLQTDINTDPPTKQVLEELLLLKKIPGGYYDNDTLYYSICIYGH